MESPTASTFGSLSPEDRRKSWTPQARNPVSVRLYKVLGTNFSDNATKEALYTLSDLYATTTGKTTDVKRDNAGELDEEDAEEDTAGAPDSSRAPIAYVNVLSEATPGESAARARKNLRRDMENKLADGSRQFLKVFGEVDQKLDELQEHITAMRGSCEQAEAQLQLTDETSKTLLEHAGKLQQERQEVKTRNSIVSLFLSRFTLNNEEIEALTSRDVPIGKRFFDVMDKAERIRKDCKVLMEGEEGPTKAGLDIIASTSTHLEQGYEKIFRWCSYEFRQIGREFHIDVSVLMQEAMRRLRKRPELLTEALTFLSGTRQTTIFNAFLTAMTRGGPSGLPRPIELHAHDPLRYVGDILAWVHQAIAAEREFLEGLFRLKHDGRMVGSVRVHRTSEEEDWIRELMDLAIGKLCMPLKSRIRQTVQSQESSITLYKVANLLQFYMVTMRRTIGEAAVLSTALQEMTNSAYKVFHDAVEAQGRALLRVPLDLDDASVTPPLAILDHVQILREITIVYQSSVLDDDNTEERESRFEHVLDVMVDPAVDMCLHAGEEKQRLRPNWDKDIFVLNCLTYLQSVLEPSAFTSQKQKEIQNLVDKRVKSLTDEHYANILSDAGIRDVTVACESHQSAEPLSYLPATSAIELQSALHKFSNWLSGVDVVQSPRLARLTVQRLHVQIHHSALERVAQAYQLICEKVRRPENKYEAASTLLGSERPFGQIHLLWQIFGPQDGTAETGSYSIKAVGHTSLD